ncbi:MAG: leucyl aminopeptidase [Gammaproteobacteria bacterium]|nr:leucyl aminopeptidase [Gammaproteobacteria bacterium]MDE0511113.1 leucyl aminopeptidase [Gammaproteobacteria bacterium]
MMDKTMKDIFLDELRLCEVGPGQTIAVLSEGDLLRDYAESSLSAASELGAHVIDANLRVEQAVDASERIANVGKNPLSEHPAVLQQCCDADMVVDHMLLLFSREQIAMQEAGTRVLLVVEPREILERLFPTPQLRKRVEAGERRLSGAKTLRFTNAAGADVTYNLNGKTVLTEYGYTCTPGRWDHWPGGFLATVAADKGVNGRVVMDTNDIIFPLKRFVKSPIEFVIRDGAVIEINGGPDAGLLKEFIDEYQDPRAYAISHIGWGLNAACKWAVDLPGIGMDGRACYGNVLFSMGPDTEFGGGNDTPCHLDLPMQNCTLMLDDELIVDEGKVVPVDMRVSHV